MHFVLRGYQGILDQPGKKPFIQILILVGKVIVAEMYLNLIIIIILNQYFDSFLTKSVYLGDMLNLSDHNPSNTFYITNQYTHMHTTPTTHPYTAKTKLSSSKAYCYYRRISLIFSIYIFYFIEKLVVIYDTNIMTH